MYWESTGNNIGFEQKGWKKLVCAGISQPSKSYNQGRYILRHSVIWVTEETLSYRRFTLANLPNSQCQIQPITYSPPRFIPLILS